jgi:hypothetical protein
MSCPDRQIRWARCNLAVHHPDRVLAIAPLYVNRLTFGATLLIREVVS